MAGGAAGIVRGGGRGVVGEIGDLEILIRYIFLLGGYISESGCPTRKAFVSDDILKRNGWSVDRLLLLAVGVGEAALARADETEKPCGYVSATAGDIRAILDDEGRSVFCVVAAPVMPENPAHALIRLARPYGNLEIKNFRLTMIEKFGEVIRP